MDDWKALIQDFLDEAYDLIENLEESLLKLEKDLSDNSGIDVVFRVAHTIKGGAGAVGFDDVTKLTHIMEDVLDLVREGKYKFIPDDISLLLEVRDELEALLKAHEHNEEHPFDKASDLIKSLEKIKNAVKSGESSGDIKEETETFDIDHLPIAARFGITKEDFHALEDAITAEEKLLLIEIRFNEEYELKEVGPFEILNLINGFAEPVIMNPSVEDMDEEYYPYLNVMITSTETVEYIEDKLNIEDVVLDVRVKAFSQDILAEFEKDILMPSNSTIQKENNSDTNTEKSENANANPTEKKAPTPSSKKDNDEKRSLVLKVESSRIDDLLNLLGELVIIRSGLSQFGSDLEESVQKIQGQLRLLFSSSTLLPLSPDEDINVEENKKFQDTFSEIMSYMEYYLEYSQQLSRISTTLQGKMMQLRMVPIQTVFSRFNRLTRDIANQLGKKVDLITEGEETEIDKGMIDDLYDPLMHMIRNSLDHAIETPDVREQLGKERKGTILLRAYQEGDSIFIEIADDGKGIDPEKIKEKALLKQFISEEKAKTMSEQEILSLIFLPRFSTAEEVSNLSGRGVGMDVVHKKIQEIGGSVTIASELGKGSTVTIQLPLTLAIIKGLVIQVGRVHYVIPIVSVEETVIMDIQKLHQFNHYYAIEFRDKLIPLIDLPSVLYGDQSFKNLVSNTIKIHNNCSENNELPEKIIEINKDENQIFQETDDHKSSYCIIIRYGDRQVGFVVPEILGEQDIVIKPLESHLIASPGIAAATIVGNGEIGFIVNISETIRSYLRKQK